MEYSTRGKHVEADLWGVDQDLLNDYIGLTFMMAKAVARSGATLLKTQGKKFSPHGVTVQLLLSESHMSIHTYPEARFAALDMYTCGENCDPVAGIQYMIDNMFPTDTEISIRERGVPPHERAERLKHRKLDQTI